MFSFSLASQHAFEATKLVLEAPKLVLFAAAPGDQFWLGIARLLGTGLLATIVSLAGILAVHRTRY